MFSGSIKLLCNYRIIEQHSGHSKNTVFSVDLLLLIPLIPYQCCNVQLYICDNANALPWTITGLSISFPLGL